MAAINDLISQIQDETLRNRIQEEVSKMAKQKKFGLVFEEDMPESTPLYDMPIKSGCNVMRRDSKDDKSIYVVLKVEGDTAVCVKPKQKDEAAIFELKDIVRVAEFGEPVYPYLKPLDSVCNAPDSDLWHTLIEADNYHALQLLEYLYMDDFPWSWWVHGGNTICKGTMRMYSTGNTSTLADMWVKCSCGARRSMSGATQHENFEGMKCSGHHPFRPNHKNEKCDKEMIPSQRGASNVYFPVMRSAISIPPWINPLYNLIDEHLRDIELAKTLMGDDGVAKIYELYFGAYAKDEFDAALERRQQNIKEFTEIKQMEYNAITHHADPVYASNKKHFKAEEDPLPDYLLPYFKRVIRITRLREVRVLLGFTRVDAPDPDADEQTNIVYLNKGKTEKWLPAAEVHGEGVFIEFNRDSIDAWLRDPELGALSQKYAQCYKEFCESKEWTVTTSRDARYVLMHTFAHLLIKQMSMSSGYSSSAIRERIYFGDDMSGVLLYTGSADKEGSLGGLVELGNIDQLIVLMKDAFQEALVCTNDPECLNNVPAGNNSNGAACHSCCMISETACENGNRMLDRGLIVPIDGRENQSYFKTLVEELCQLEV